MGSFLSETPNRIESKYMSTGKVVIDITDREKIFINPNNGNRITKLKGGTEIPNSSPHQIGVQASKLGKSGGDKEKKEGESGNLEAEKVEDLSVNKDEKLGKYYGRNIDKNMPISEFLMLVQHLIKENKALTRELRDKEDKDWGIGEYKDG